MAMFKMNPMMAGDPSMVVVAGSCVFTNTGAAPANTIVPATLFNASKNALGAGIGQNETVAPQGSKVTHVINPNTGYAPAVATGGNANVVLLDLRAYPGDLVSVQVAAVGPANATAGALTTTAYDAAVLGIDQTNNFVYIMMTTGSGGATNAANGLALHYQVYFKDGFAP